MNKKLELADVIDIIKDYINNKNKEAEFMPSGKSMLPIIVDGEDKVVLSKFNKLKRLDIILYQRKSGEYVLHRIIKIENNQVITACGDNQVFKEKNIDVSQVIGKVVKIIKKDGKVIKVDCDKKYRFKSRIIVIKRPFKSVLVRIKNKCMRRK